MFNASLFEKIVLGTMVSSTAVFAVYSIFKDPQVKKEDAFKTRQELIHKRNVKMLYSTMSFFYLQGFRSKDPESFVTLQSILNIETPQIVAVPLSKEDFDEKYEKSINHPRFREAMDRFRFNVKNKKLQEILDVKDFNLKNLQLLYLIDHCINIKSCKVVYARREANYYHNIDEAFKKLPAKQQTTAIDSNQAKIEDYTEILIREMKPQLKFALSPQSPFKHIVGIVQPELMVGISRRWKQKFRQTYSHVVMEDEEVLVQEEAERKKEGEFKKKFELEKQGGKK